MPRINPNRTGGARHGAVFLGVSQPRGEHPVLAKRRRRARRKLLREAQALIQSTDLEVAGRRLESLKRRWDVLGSSYPEDEQRLRKRFQEACAEVSRNCAKHQRA